MNHASIMLVVVLGLAASSTGDLKAAPQGQSSVHDDHADILDHLLDKPGRSLGLLKKLRFPGSSGGVARGDFNADGIADLAIGTPLENVAGTTKGSAATDGGSVVVIYGSATGLVALSASVPSAQLWHQNILGIDDTAETGDNFGAALAAGDFDADGDSDLAIAVPGERDATGARVGGVHVLYGAPTTGLTVTGDRLFFASEVGTSFPPTGMSLVWADFNGDTRGDLAIEALSSGPSGQVGQIAVLLGSGTGLTTTGSQLLTMPADTGFNTGEAGVLANLVLSAGDFNIDGRAELVVGAPLGSVGTVQSAGNVRVLPGTLNGVTLTGAQLFHQNVAGVPEAAETGDEFGAALAVGDFNFDTFLDLAVGVPRENNGLQILPALTIISNNQVTDGGAVNIIFGTAGGLNAANGQILFEAAVTSIEGGSEGDRGVEANDRNGTSLAAGDFNGDGISDLAVGAPGETLGSAAGAGSVSVFHGSNTGFSTTRQFWTEGTTGINGTPVAGDNFGASLSAWNFGRNHNIAFVGSVRTADLAIGIPGMNIAGVADAGAVRVIYGFTTGLATSAGVYNAGPFTPRPGPSQLWHEELPDIPGVAETDDRFGTALY